MNVLKSKLPAIAALLLVSTSLFSYISGAKKIYFAIWYYLGVWQFPEPFLDLRGLLGPMECYRNGVDVYVTDPCDLLGRPHAYTPLWLWIGAITPVQAAWTPVAGVILVAGFIAMLFTLPPARTWFDSLVLTVATLSYSVAYAIERGNNDLVIFILIAGSALLLQSGPRSRSIAYGTIIFAGLLKFYPLVALVVLVRERWPALLAGALAAAAALTVFLAFGYHDVLRMLQILPGRDHYSEDMFGANNLIAGMVAAAALDARTGAALKFAFFIGSFAIATAVAISKPLKSRLVTLTRREAMTLILGAGLMCGCFYIGPSGGYRAVLLLFALPGLLRLWRVNPRDVCGAYIGIALGCAMVCMWSGFEYNVLRIVPRWIPVSAETTHLAFGALWTILQIAWWWLATTLLSIVLAMALQSEFARAIFNRHDALPAMLIVPRSAAHSSSAPTG